jgi:hypothetical protein
LSEDAFAQGVCEVVADGGYFERPNLGAIDIWKCMVACLRYVVIQAGHRLIVALDTGGGRRQETENDCMGS